MGYILYRCQVIHDNVEYQIKLGFDTDTRIYFRYLKYSTIAISNVSETVGNYLNMGTLG